MKEKSGLRIGGMSAAALGKRFGTPLYIYDASTIRERARELRGAFPDIRVHYAVKANTNPSLLKIILDEGCALETVSKGELAIARRAGARKEDLSFTCSNITAEELAFAAKHAGIVHLDSLTQLELWGRKKLGKTVSLRVNQGIGAGHHAHVVTGGPRSKFGIAIPQLKEALSLARKYGLRVTGLHQHIGSNILDARIYLSAVEALLRTAKGIPGLRTIDLGGGIGIPYRPHETRLDLPALGSQLTTRLRAFRGAYGQEIAFAMEPGRYLVAESGILLVEVVDVKKNPHRTFVGVNSGFNHLIRPAMYGSYHEIVPVSRRPGKSRPATIAGNVCESGDVFAWDRPLPPVALGDMLAIMNAGAYGFTMASRYNARELPKEILIDGGKARLISPSLASEAFGALSGPRAPARLRP